MFEIRKNNKIKWITPVDRKFVLYVKNVNPRHKWGRQVGFVVIIRDSDNVD